VSWRCPLEGFVKFGQPHLVLLEVKQGTVLLSKGAIPIFLMPAVSLLKIGNVFKES
jgi:hypothetical protein